MGLLDKITGLFKKDYSEGLASQDLDKMNFPDTESKITEAPVEKQESYDDIELPEGELASFSEEILDTNSPIAIKKFKHNLQILIQKAKTEKKIDKFMLIREDDFFPEGMEWRVLSKNTNLEKAYPKLSLELRKAYALKQSGIEPYRELMGVKIPNATFEQEMEALSKIDKDIGTVLLPSHFRSTKHFTINTPLEVTGDYNNVETERDYIFIDDIAGFLNSGYAYSVDYRDAYLDISHESLPISENAVILINDKNFERVTKDEKIAEELSSRRVVRFKGDETIAIDMILTELGALPSKVGFRYAEYDNEIRDILETSIEGLAKNNNLLFRKSHGGELKPSGGHFSNYYDSKNQDYARALEDFSKFISQKFPEQFKDTFRGETKLLEEVEPELIIEAINEYNEHAQEKIKNALENYKEDRKKITPEIHQAFVRTVHKINDFYERNTETVSRRIRK